MILKKLERSWKSLWFGALTRYLRRKPPPEPLDWSSGRRRILFLRPDGIGDAIVSTPLLRSLAGISPDLTVDVVASPANAPFLARLDSLDNVFILDKRRRGGLPPLLRRLHREGYDAVIDPRVIAPSMTTGLVVMLATGAPHRLGVTDRGADEWLTTAVPLRDGHIVETLSGFAPPFGLDPGRIDWRPTVPLSEEERVWGAAEWARMAPAADPRRLLVNVSAGERPRVWPEESFVEVIGSVTEGAPELRVIVVGAPDEQERVDRIATASRAIAVATPTLGHLMGLVAGADVVLTPDTSVVHIASALRKRTVAMYLKGTARQWGAWDVSGANLESADGSLRNLPPQQVITALRTVL